MRARDPGTPLGSYRSRYGHGPTPDILPGSNNVAQQQLGKAGISLCFQEDHSFWGVYNQKEAAVLQFYTGRHEPKGYKLCELIIEITFTSSLTGRVDTIQDQLKHSDPYLLTKPSPRLIKGPDTLRELTKDWNIEPGFDIGGSSVSIGCFGQKAKWCDTGCWHYSSDWTGPGQRYTTARWKWQANRYHYENEDIGDLYGGVVLCHTGQPFLMSCSVQGKLVSKPRRWFKYGSSGGPQVFRMIPSSDQHNLDQMVAELEDKIRGLTEGASATRFLSKESVSPAASTGSAVQLASSM